MKIAIKVSRDEGLLSYTAASDFPHRPFSGLEKALVVATLGWLVDKNGAGAFATWGFYVWGLLEVALFVKDVRALWKRLRTCPVTTREGFEPHVCTEPVGHKGPHQHTDGMWWQGGEK